jgi:hypothetical protein
LVVTKQLKRNEEIDGKTMKLDGNPWNLMEIHETWWKSMVKSIQDSGRNICSQPFQQLSRRKLIVVRCVRPDRVLPAVQVFVVPCRQISMWQGTTVSDGSGISEDHMD